MANYFCWLITETPYTPSSTKPTDQAIILEYCNFKHIFIQYSNTGYISLSKSVYITLRVCI